MTDNVKTLLARAKDPKEITTWEMLFTQRASGPTHDDFARSPTKFCGHANGLLVSLTAAEVDELRAAGAQAEPKKRPPTFPDFW